MKRIVILGSLLLGLNIYGQPVLTGIVGPPHGLMKEGQGEIRFLIKGDVFEHCLLANSKNLDMCRWNPGPPPQEFHFKNSGVYVLSLWLKDQTGNISHRSDTLPLRALYSGARDDQNLMFSAQLIVFFDNSEPVASIEQDFTVSEPIRELASESSDEGDSLNTYTFSLDMFAFSKSYQQKPNSR